MVLYPDVWCYFASASSAVFAVFGVFGNLLTIVALLKSEKLRRHATTSFLLSLTFSDLLFCAISMPMTSVRYFNKAWTFGDALCKVFPFIFYSNIAVSMLSMILMTLNRYILITFQHLYQKFYKCKYICLQLALAWGLAFLIMFFPLLGLWGELGYSEETFSCTILKKNGKSPKTFIFLVGFILPCFIIVLSYSCIFYTVRKQHSKLSKFDTSTTTTSTKSKLNFFRNKNDLRLTIMMLTIFICFILCFLPLMITNVYDDDTKYPAIHILASILAWSSAVINPIIYAVGSSQYRNAYTNLFVKFKTWKSSVSSGNNNKLQHSIDPDDSMQNEKLSTIVTKAKPNHVITPLEIT